MTVADAVADARRTLDVRRVLLRVAYFAFFVLAFKQLGRTDITSGTQMIWLLLPIPLLVAGFMEWGSDERQGDELRREILRDANGLAFRATFFVLFWLLLADRAFGFPFTLQNVFGLGSITIAWPLMAFVPLLAWTLAFFVAHRRRTRT